MTEKSIIKESRDHFKTDHPTQKPVRLLERIIALVSKQGDVILDTFSGGGSTLKAAVNTNRIAIGIEIDKEYFELSNKNLSEAINSKTNTLF
jgi:site-specific DNA-methyltransferase (adenine-specific)